MYKKIVIYHYFLLIVLQKLVVFLTESLFSLKIAEIQLRDGNFCVIRGVVIPTTLEPSG